MTSEDLPSSNPARVMARWLLFLIGNALIAFLAFSVLEFLSNPIGLGGIDPPWVPDAVLATNTLFEAAPTAQSSGPFQGYDKFTPEAMEQRAGNVDWSYVPANEPSTGPLVVSVNPIDRFQWGAAAKSQQNNYCYLVLLYADRENPDEYGGFKFAALPPSAECKGIYATPERVRAENWPYAPARQEPWATLGLVVAFLAAAGVVLSRILRVRLGKAARWTVHLVGMFLLVAGLWTSSTTIA